MELQEAQWSRGHSAESSVRPPPGPHTLSFLGINCPAQGATTKKEGMTPDVLLTLP